MSKEKRNALQLGVADNDPNYMEYLICFTEKDVDNDDGKSFSGAEIVTGRKELYEFIKVIIEDIDVYNSFILSDVLSFKDRISVARFLTIAEDKKWFDDDFKIGDYVDRTEVSF